MKKTKNPKHAKEVLCPTFFINLLINVQLILHKKIENIFLR